ncbi:MAG: sodium/proline symporter PutP [Rothia sp. (in: high G+C Gram-positive bacteria)]|uniref:sodium/proline symporter PutP n=1 Tax=Rothia sp. (in: high G+C Gram-positive bacteria) TaxID=1885016 RepID=UPI00270E152A|nr:sodium/proline symporter PutP [Rothia sp. (in: high G+C Gram-positive bacteria)]
MSNTTYQLIALAIYFAAMVGIGIWAKSKNKSLDDYVLGGRSLSPTAAALSAGASDMSGWLLMGLPGALYITGLAEAWIAIGLTIGAWLNWKFVAPRLRAYTEVSSNSVTVPSFFHNRLRDSRGIIRIFAALVILIFFTFYVSSGMVAGGVFFQSSFGGNYHTGMLLVAGITVAYTLFGGFLGATYTDVVQGLLMLTALIVLPIMALIYVGGFSGLESTIESVNPTALSLFAGTTLLGILSSAAWGLGYFGQPHIIVRFMGLRSAQDATAGRRIGITWMVATLVGAMSAGLIGIAYFARHPEATLTDATNAESVFLDMSQILLHPLLAGFVLAAVLAAIMSTLSSQLIVCSSALAEDLYKLTSGGKELSDAKGLWLGRAGVLVVSIIAGLLAWNPDSSVLSLVSFAWAGFGAAFGPIVILSLYWRKLTAAGAVAGMVAGAITVFVWGYNEVLSGYMYEIVPGFLVNLLFAYLVSVATYKGDSAATHEINEEFDRAVELSR